MTNSTISKFENVIKSTREMTGGGDVKNRPTGGFLPIIECVKSDIVNEENKNREFTSKKSSVSITEIMKKRRGDLGPLVL